MIKPTLQQIQRIRQIFGAVDENEIAIISHYLQKHLDKNSVIAFYAGTPLKISLVNEIKVILNKYYSSLLPLINQTRLQALNYHEATKLAAQLLADSTITLITSDNELAIPDSQALQTLTCFFNAVHKSGADPEQIINIVNKLFEFFPETKSKKEFEDLLIHATAIIENKAQNYQIINLTKEKLGLTTNIDANLINNAYNAFHQWKRSQKNHIGTLRAIIELTDKITHKHPSLTKLMIDFVSHLFSQNLSNENLASKFFIKFTELVNILIMIDDKRTIHSLCFHLTNNTQSLKPWTLIEILDNQTFKLLSNTERKQFFNIITTALNNAHTETRLLEYIRLLLKKCENPKTKSALLRRLNELYQSNPPPPLETVVSWLNQLNSSSADEIATALEANYILFNNSHKPFDTPLTKQLNKLRKQLDSYAQTSFFHTRKHRASELHEFSTAILIDIDNQSSEQKTAIQKQVIVELYLQYASIENASGILSRALEKRLIKLLDIPKDDAQLQAALFNRDTFTYKLHNFFTAGRCFFKTHKDKDTDPVRQVIWRHLPRALKDSIHEASERAATLDLLDREETSAGVMRH